jgi:drug/metabolite transporter (DMT)-like permease
MITINNFTKATLCITILSIIWYVLGILFVPISAVDHEINYFYSTLFFALILFLPFSTYLFATNKIIQRISLSIVLLGSLFIIIFLYSYFFVDDYADTRQEYRAFDMIYTSPFLILPTH